MFIIPGGYLWNDPLIKIVQHRNDIMVAAFVFLIISSAPASTALEIRILFLRDRFTSVFITTLLAVMVHEDLEPVIIGLWAFIAQLSRYITNCLLDHFL